MFAFILSLCHGGHAQPLHGVPPPVRSGSYSTAPRHALQTAANQAALAYFKLFSAAVYGEKQFLLRELSLYHAAVVQPIGSGAYGLQLRYAGDADYNATSVGFAYGRGLGEKMALGLQFNYINQHLRGYGNAAQVTAEGSLMVHISEQVSGGFQLSHPAGISLNKNMEKLPAVYTIGAGYQPSPQFGITAELIKSDNLPLALLAGLEYHFAPTLWTKAGIHTGTHTFYIGAGYRLQHFSMEAIGSAHPQLGFSPALLFIFNGMGK